MTINNKAAITMGAALLLVATLVGGQEPTTGETNSSEPTEEIVVYGEPSLVLLQRAVYAAEVRFFDAFNALNTDDEFDVICHKTFRIEAHRRIRVCEPRFVINYERDLFMGWNPNLATLRRQEEELVHKMLEHVVTDADLEEAFTELASAKNDYEMERRQRRFKRSKPDE